MTLLFIQQVLGGAYIISPNPASTEINITKRSTSNINEQVSYLDLKDEKVNVYLYNFNGAVVRTEQYPVSQTSYMLNVSDLKQGNYFMKISEGKHEEIHQIVIKR